MCSSATVVEGHFCRLVHFWDPEVDVINDADCGQWLKYLEVTSKTLWHHACWLGHKNPITDRPMIWLVGMMSHDEISLSE